MTLHMSWQIDSAMRLLLACAVMTSFHAVASADTRIVEYPDHYYVESTEASTGKTETAQDGASAGKSEPASADMVKETTDPSTPLNTNKTPARRDSKPVYNEEEAAALRPDLVAELERLENERSQLLDFDVAAHPDEVNSRRQQAIEIIQQINQISADLKQYYLQYKEQMRQSR